MKTYIQKDLRDGAYIMLSMLVILPVLAYIFPQYRQMLTSAWFVYAIVCIASLIVLRRHFPMAKIKDKTVTSHALFGRLLCDVDCQKPIYYAMVDLQSREGTSHFIAISNANFSCGEEKGTLGYPFFKCYNEKQIILLPYDEKTIPILDLSNYICVTSEQN